VRSVNDGLDHGLRHTGDRSGTRGIEAPCSWTVLTPWIAPGFIRMGGRARVRAAAHRGSRRTVIEVGAAHRSGATQKPQAAAVDGNLQPLTRLIRCVQDCAPELGVPRSHTAWYMRTGPGSRRTSPGSTHIEPCRGATGVLTASKSPCEHCLTRHIIFSIPGPDFGTPPSLVNPYCDRHFGHRRGGSCRSKSDLTFFVVSALKSRLREL